MEFKLKYDNENKIHRFLRMILISVVSLVTLLYVWWIVSIVVGSVAIPAPPQVWDAFVRLMTGNDPITGHSMWTHIFSSLERFISGFLLTFAIAVPLGLLIGYSRTLYEFSKPIIEVLRPIAPIAWAPIFIIGIWGFGWGPVMVVFVGIFFPLLTSTIFGVQKIDQNLIDASKTLGANKLQTFYKVMFPCTVPYIMNGIKIGLGIGWMCIIAAEMISVEGKGLGFFIFSTANLGGWPFVFVGIILISILGLLTIGLAEYAQRTVAKRTGME